ncbi:uncharacterized protein LOC112569351 isoform X1 [Pomacea canaliculata]|uniref:uncharacterized protein LOC112569351 isoform X1 n=1 Tax=Pomacea canaliculata TaxID=400727 RepID=UPI000D729163|nr:uncharacterized protein LOC112569351 isoform X1 [Pomacea canaliculata]XP_025102926.1 uncharacterized protein LOC112569351 isoform X1 [Pomacea canaliculata]
MKIIILLCLLTAVLGYSYNDTMIEEDFRELDRNSDGSYSFDEFEKRFKTLDVNDDLRINFVEFHKCLRPGTPLPISYAVFNIYDQLDNHKDSFTDIWNAKMTFSVMDINHDKNVTLEELKHHVAELNQRTTYASGVTA